MISKSLSTSERFASLHPVAGKLAEFCQSLYPLLVAHADDWGCLPGDVFTVKHLVNPTSPRKLSEFESALRALHNVKLIAWYQVPEDEDGEHAGRWVIHIRGFAAHQTLKGHDKDGRKRNYPAPPENISDFDKVAQKRPESPKVALREENLTELNRTEPIRSLHATSEAVDADLSPAGDNREVGAFLKAFCELYSKHRHGAKYAVNRAKDVPTVRRLLTVYGPERLEKVATVLLTTDEEWIEHTDRGIGILSVKASWCDGMLATYEAEHGTKAAS